MYVDSHIHLTHRLFDGQAPCVSPGSKHGVENYNREELIEAIKNQGIAFVIEPAIDIESNYKILNFVEDNSHFVFPAVGVHPTRTWNEKWNRRLIIKN